jgi:large subunit ribosomal protein L14
VIQPSTILVAADNSGAKSLNVIRVLGGSYRRYGLTGDLVVVSVRDATPGGRVKKGEVHKAILVRTKARSKRSGAARIAFGDNAAVLVKIGKGGEKEPVGTRVFGPVDRILRFRNCSKLLSLAREVW